ncbi:MAG: hypothetical protein ACT4N1_03465 [Nitrososphaerota archaeon]
MVDLTPIDQMASIGTAVGTLALVALFWMALKQMGETQKLSKVQLEHRFRPWVGPTTAIELLSSADGRHQFGITIKNYGELPASNVVTLFSLRNDKPTREIIKKPDAVESQNLGPLLPNMEKRYWFFVDSDLVQKSKNGDSQIFVMLYFSYEYREGKNGYGMISQFDPKTDSFIHKEMWVD